MLNTSDVIDWIFVSVWMIILFCLYYIPAYCVKTNIVEYNTQTNSNSFLKNQILRSKQSPSCELGRPRDNFCKGLGRHS